MWYSRSRIIECQDCGVVLRSDLSMQEVQHIANHPHDMWFYCPDCMRAREREAELDVI